MERQTFLLLTTTSQWILFAAIGLVIFSWAERNFKARQAGQLLFAALGVFSLWVILSGKIIVPIPRQGEPAPIEAKALTFFSGLIITSLLGIAGFFLERRKKPLNLTKYINPLLVILALFLFFMVYQLQQQ